MITNKDIRVENGSLILNGDHYPLDGQSPEAIMEIVEDNSDTTPTAESTAPVTSAGIKTYVDTAIGDLTQTGVTGASVAAQITAIDTTLDTIHPDASSLASTSLTLTGVLDIPLIFRETGNDDYKGVSVYDKDNVERYRLFFVGGHLKFVSKAADGTTIVDTTIA